MRLLQANMTLFIVIARLTGLQPAITPRQEAGKHRLAKHGRQTKKTLLQPLYHKLI